MRMDAPYSAHPLFKGRIDSRLKAYRACLGHSVCNFNLGHIHLFIDLVHCVYWARRPCHNPSAQSLQIIFRKVRKGQFRYKHSRYTIKSRCIFFLHSVKHSLGLESFARINCASPVSETSKICHYHAKTVIKRHGDHQSVAFVKIHRLSNKVAIIQNIMMAQRRAFRKAGRAARVLNIYWIIHILIFKSRDEQLITGFIS